MGFNHPTGFAAKNQPVVTVGNFKAYVRFLAISFVFFFLGWLGDRLLSKPRSLALLQNDLKFGATATYHYSVRILATVDSSAHKPDHPS